MFNICVMRVGLDSLFYHFPHEGKNQIIRCKHPRNVQYMVALWTVVPIIWMSFILQ